MAPLPPAAGSAGPDAERLLAVIRQLARELRPGAGDVALFGLDHSLERDFGFDSLARVELVARLQRDLASPRAAASGEALLAAETPRELLHLIAAATAQAGTATKTEANTEASAKAESAPALPLPAAASGGSRPGTAPAGTHPGAAQPVGETLGELLDWHAAEHPQATAFRLLGEAAAEDVSYGEMQAAARGLAAGLLVAGVEPGDRVAIMLPTGRDFFAAFYGVLHAGAVPVPLYPPARPTQLEDHMRRIAGIVANAGATVLVADPRARLLGRLLRADCPALRVVATVGELTPKRTQTPTPNPTRDPAAARPRRPDDIAFLQYTSGSTGQPKGVVLTHANLLANLRAMQSASGIGAADVFVSWLPLYHDMGLIGACLGSLAVGFRLVLMPPQAFLARPEHWLRTISDEHASVSAAPNFAYEICATKIDDSALAGLNLASWRLAYNGAEPVAAGTIDRFCARFAGCGFARTAMTPVYGLAENALGLTFPPVRRGPLIDRIDRAALARGEALPAAAGDARPLQVVCCGRVLPGHRLRIADAGSRALPERRVGRVQFQGPSAASGYFGRDEIGLHNGGLHDGEWTDSGDLGYLADGELYLTGRAKDIIIRGGHNLYPQELEEAAGKLAGVRRGGVAVFAAGEPDDSGERIVVVAETRLAGADERAALQRAIASLAVDLLGVPADDIVLAPPQTVPKTSSGKIRRSACRERYERGELVPHPRAPWLQLLRLAAGGLPARAKRRVAQLADRLWSAWAWTVFTTIVPPAWLLVTLAPTLGLRRRCARGCARLALAACGLSPRIDDLARLPREKPCIVVANHASYVDSLILTAVLPPCFAFVAKRELADRPLAAIPLARLGAAYVERFDSARGLTDTQELEARAAAGDSLVFFPEGTFRAAPGLLPFRLGAFSVAAGSGLIVVPVCLTGTRCLLPSGRWRPQRAPLAVHFGPPMHVTDRQWGDIVGLRDAARAWIAAQTGEDGGNAPGQP